MTNPPSSTKHERRTATRLKAQEQRRRHARAQRRRRLLLQTGIGVALIAIITVVALVVVTAPRSAGAGPRNMADGGIALTGSNLTAVRTEAAASNSTPALPGRETGGRVLIQTYEDFGCPVCREFEAQHGPQLQSLVKSGAAVIEYHPVAILDTHFTDGSYSSRAANAAAAVANWSPDSYRAFHSLLYSPSVQPAEAGPGLTNDRLIALVQQVHPTDEAKIAAAIRTMQFKRWVQARSAEFIDSTGSLTGVQFPPSRRGPGTPTVVVNGQYWDPSRSDLGAFITAVGGAITPSPSATSTD